MVHVHLSRLGRGLSGADPIIGDGALRALRKEGEPKDNCVLIQKIVQMYEKHLLT